MVFRIFAVLSLLLATALPAQACRFKPVPFEESLKRAEVVFVGTVTSVDEGKFTWKVEKGVRGVKDGDTYVSEYGGSSCDLRFNAGDRWIFLGAGVPSGSLLLEDARGNKMEDNIKALKQLGVE